MQMVKFERPAKEPTLDEISELLKEVLGEQAQPVAYQGQQSTSPYQSSVFDGADFQFGFGPTTYYTIDIDALRQRSEQLITDNPYALGILNRIITAFINTGVFPELQPKHQILGVPMLALETYVTAGEQRFDVWADSPEMCDYEQKRTFFELQQLIEFEAMVSGDVLVVMRPNQTYNTYSMQIIKATALSGPVGGRTTGVGAGNSVEDGIEIDGRGREVAYWYTDKKGGRTRVEAIDRATGFRRAFLVMSSRHRIHRRRGIPILATVLQLLADSNRLRASALRQAYVASLLSVFIKRTSPGGGIPSLGTGPARRVDGRTLADGAEFDRPAPQVFNPAPGITMYATQPGDEPVAFNSTPATNTNLGQFIEIMLEAASMHLGVPTDVLRMRYSQSFSAAMSSNGDLQHSTQEFWKRRGAGCYGHIFRIWLAREVLSGRVDAPGLIDTIGDNNRRTEFKAWFFHLWQGRVKPPAKMKELIDSYTTAVENGWVTNEIAARNLFGTKFSDNIQKLTIEETQQQARPTYVANRPNDTAPNDNSRAAPTDVDGDDDDEDAEDGAG